MMATRERMTTNLSTNVQTNTMVTTHCNTTTDMMATTRDMMSTTRDAIATTMKMMMAMKIAPKVDTTIMDTVEMDGMKNTTIMSWNCNSSQIPSWPNFRP